MNEYEAGFVAWLGSHYAGKTVEDYLRDWRWYVLQVGQARALVGSYADVLEYVGHLRNRYKSGKTVRYYLSGVKAWHRYLVQAGIRTDNPSATMRIRDIAKPRLAIEKLVEVGELEKLAQDSRAGRSRVLLGLLVYQALRVGELQSLRVQDIDLQQGTVHIVHKRWYCHRVLPLEFTQVRGLQAYINAKGLGDKGGLCGLAGDAPLLSTSTGRCLHVVAIREIIWRESQRLLGRRLNAQLVRQSVLRQKLKAGYDVRVVQAFAGHSKPSVTERYWESKLEELQRGIGRYHPLQ